METILTFFTNYGLILTLIAVCGIIILGILKYLGVFAKIEEQYRHYLYLVISVGVTLIATCIYLLIINAFTIEYICIIGTAVFALNQTFYAIFKVTPINELSVQVLDFIKALFKKQVIKVMEEEGEE